MIKALTKDNRNGNYNEDMDNNIELRCSVYGSSEYLLTETHLSFLR